MSSLLSSNGPNSTPCRLSHSPLMKAPFLLTSAEADLCCCPGPGEAPLEGSPIFKRLSVESNLFDRPKCLCPRGGLLPGVAGVEIFGGYLQDFMVSTTSRMPGRFHLSCAQHWWMSPQALSLRGGSSSRGGRSPLETARTMYMAGALSKGMVS